MQSAVTPQIRVEPVLRAELESVLRQGETLTDFSKRLCETPSHFGASRLRSTRVRKHASEEYHQTGVSVPVEAVLGRLQAKRDAKRKTLGR